MTKRLPLFLFALLSFFSFLVHAQKTPKRELRGAWVTTHLNLDWPFSSAHTVQRQKDSLVAILDQHKATGINTIYFQVRNQCDALYPSTIEPWASVLTGVQGRDPGWDPLQFAIDECRKRGLELHAWLNPYRAVANAANLPAFSPTHIARQRPEWLLAQGAERILNPGLPEVRNYLLSVITDIVNRYDVDGIHFDDYFYIAPATGVTPYNDDATYAADPRGFPATPAGRADWRRDNVNLLIKSVYETLRGLKPWVKFGVSPSGIYRSSTNPAIGSNTSSGAFQHYSAIFADSRRWLQEGWVDYLAPQVYWFIGQTGSDYAVLVPWWNNQASGRHIYIGQAIYKVNDPAQGANWANRSQIPNQMRFNRSTAYPNVYGEIGFRTRFFRLNPLNVRDSIRQNIYRRPALQPLMPWVDNTPPAAPTGLTAVRQNDGSYLLTWTKPSTGSNELDKVRQFVIYRAETPVMDLSDTANLLTITPTDAETYTDNSGDPAKIWYYQVTALDRLANESAPSNVSDNFPPAITCPGNGIIELGENCAATLHDLRAMAVVSDDVTPAGQLLITQSPAAGSTVNGVGEMVVTLTVTDAAGKSAACTLTLMKEDKLRPVVTAPVAEGSTTLRNTDAGTCGYTPGTAFDISATDNCGNALTVHYQLTTNGVQGAMVNSATLQGTILPKGTTIVNWTVADASGNTTGYQYTIVVEDKEPPTTVCPQDLVVNPTSLAGAVVSFAPPTGIDNCEGAVTTQTAGPASGSIFPIGTTVIRYKVVDAAGHEAACSFSVTVRDPYCDNNSNSRKVYVCHNGKTQCVSVNALNTFLRKGARLGLCEWYEENAVTRLGNSREKPAQYAFAVYPNPVKDRIQIGYALPAAANLTVRIFDLAGREVAMVFSGKKEAGRHTLEYNLATLREGVYYCRMVAEGKEGTVVQTGRLVKLP